MSAPSYAKRIETPLGIRYFQRVGDGLWFVMSADDDDEGKTIEAPNDAPDKTLIHALMKATCIW